MNNEIKNIIEQAKKDKSSRSSGDLEIKFMKEMLNSDSKIDVYKPKKGLVGDINPRQDLIDLTSSALQSAGIGKEEAASIASNYQVNNKEAASYVNITKNFVPLYLETGKKFEFTKTENVNSALILKDVEASERNYNGNMGEGTYTIPAHKKVTSKGKNLY